MVDTFQIYCLTNRVNGKRYVGQTTQGLDARWHEHAKNAVKGRGCRALSAAIAKHGPQAFDRDVIDTANSQESANFAERDWIERLGTLAPGGYNLHAGGGARGFSAESLRKMSEAAIRRDARMTPEQRSARVCQEPFERRSEIAKARWARMSAEKREARAMKISDSLRASAKNTAAIQRRWDAMTPSERSAHAKKTHAAQTPEQRSARQKKAWAGLPAEKRAQIINNLHLSLAKKRAS